MMYKCIEAPCSYQDPSAELIQLTNGDYQCPYCKRTYDKLTLERLTRLTPCIGGDEDCHLFCCNIWCDEDIHCEYCNGYSQL